MSETLRDLVVSLSLNSDHFTRNIKSINKHIQEAESAFHLASAGVENFETTTAGLSAKLSTLQRTFQLQQDAVGEYERALQQASDKLQETLTDSTRTELQVLKLYRRFTGDCSGYQDAGSDGRGDQPTAEETAERILLREG